jgi:hypothetical protein
MKAESQEKIAIMEAKTEAENREKIAKIEAESRERIANMEAKTAMEIREKIANMEAESRERIAKMQSREECLAIPRAAGYATPALPGMPAHF